MNINRILPAICLILFFITSCGDDYIENGIEGRWQLRQVTSPDGQTAHVDTIFFSFKKAVFEYRMLSAPAQASGCFGIYSEQGDMLEITLDPSSYFPEDGKACPEWEELTRSYRIKTKTSSAMELEHGGSTYNFRKY